MQEECFIGSGSGGGVGGGCNGGTYNASIYLSLFIYGSARSALSMRERKYSFKHTPRMRFFRFYFIIYANKFWNRHEIRANRMESECRDWYVCARAYQPLAERSSNRFILLATHKWQPKTKNAFTIIFSPSFALLRFVFFFFIFFIVFVHVHTHMYVCIENVCISFVLTIFFFFVVY